MKLIPEKSSTLLSITFIIIQRINIIGNIDASLHNTKLTFAAKYQVKNIKSTLPEKIIICLVSTYSFVNSIFMTLKWGGVLRI